MQRWAREHELPYFDDKVHYPDFRIEYEVEGRERREDVDVLTPHSRRAAPSADGLPGETCLSEAKDGEPSGNDLRGEALGRRPEAETFRV